MESQSHFTEPTAAYWLQTVAADQVPQMDPPWQFGCPVKLPNGRYLILPIRQLPAEPTHGIASLLANAASFEVIDDLSSMLAEQIRPYHPDVVVGLPTLGHALCPGVAKGLGHTRYIPLGYSKKFWYETALSAPVSSVTTPDVGLKRIWIDPHHLKLLKDRRVALVDDAVSSGTTLLAAWKLLESLGVQVVVCGVAMRQGDKWQRILGKERVDKLVGVFDSPLLQAVAGGWTYRDLQEETVETKVVKPAS